MPGSCCLASLVVLFPESLYLDVHACMRVLATVSVHMFVLYVYVRRCGFIISHVCACVHVHVCMQTSIIKVNVLP